MGCNRLRRLHTLQRFKFPRLSKTAKVVELAQSLILAQDTALLLSFTGLQFIAYGYYGHTKVSFRYSFLLQMLKLYWLLHQELVVRLISSLLKTPLHEILRRGQVSEASISVELYSLLTLGVEVLVLSFSLSSFLLSSFLLSYFLLSIVWFLHSWSISNGPTAAGVGGYIHSKDQRLLPADQESRGTGMSPLCPQA